MNQITKISVLISVSSVLLFGCSNNDNNNNQSASTDTDNQEPNTEEADENKDNNDEFNNLVKNESGESDSSKNVEHVDHEEGLKLGETGTVIDNQGKKYEVTLNSVKYVDTVADMEPKGETHAVVNITVKNIGDDSFNAKNIYQPGFGPPKELEASLNSIYMDVDSVDQDLLKGEIAPGESISGDHVYFVEKIVDNYDFVIGGKGTQIISYANWEVSDSEIE